MTFAAWLVALLVASLPLAPHVAADPVDATNQNPASQTREQPTDRIQPAPGGGEMLFAGPTLEYVARARAKSDATLAVECNHVDQTKANSDRE